MEPKPMQAKTRFLAAGLAAALLFPAAGLAVPSPAAAQATAGQPASALESLAIVSGDKRHAFQVEVMRTPEQRARGLMHRRYLPGGWFASPDTAGFNAFSGRYQQRFHAAPTRTATLAYDAVSLSAALARTQGSQRFSEPVLTNASGFAGADGVFRFRVDGQVERGLAVLELRNGRIVTVNAAPRDLGPPTQ